MELGVGECYSFSIEDEKEKKWKSLNFLPMIRDIMGDERDISDRAYLFHLTLARGFVEMATLAEAERNIRKVGLTGGVFQNTLLLKLTKDLLEESGFEVLIHSGVPPNDGGISLGQAFLAAGRFQK